MKLLIDEMYSPRIAGELRSRGHDVLSGAEIQLVRGQSDAAVFNWGKQNGYAVLTENVAHFLPLHRDCLLQGNHHFGLIFSSPKSMPRSSDTVGLFVRSLDSLLAAFAEADSLCDGISWLTPAE